RFRHSEFDFFAVLRAEFELRVLPSHLLGGADSFLELIFYGVCDSEERLLKVLFEANPERVQLGQHSLDLSTNRRECFRSKRQLVFLVFRGAARCRHFFAVTMVSQWP